MTVGELIKKLADFDLDAVAHIAFNNEVGPVRDVFEMDDPQWIGVQRERCGVYVCS